jgi:hypothetical protein
VDEGRRRTRQRRWPCRLAVSDIWDGAVRSWRGLRCGCSSDGRRRWMNESERPLVMRRSARPVSDHGRRPSCQRHVRGTDEGGRR